MVMLGCCQTQMSHLQCDASQFAHCGRPPHARLPYGDEAVEQRGAILCDLKEAAR